MKTPGTQVTTPEIPVKTTKTPVTQVTTPGSPMETTRTQFATPRAQVT